MDVASSKPGSASRTIRFFTSTAQSDCRGYTLVELLVAVSILVILTSYAAPSIKRFIDDQRQIAYLNTLAATFYLARSEAIMRVSDVVVCKSNDGQQCTTSGEWEQGWMVYEDRDRDRNRDAEEPVLARHESLTGITVRYRGIGSTHYIVYRPQGITKTNGTYTFCDSGGPDSARALIVFKTGRARSSTVSSNGSALTCPP